MSLKDSFAIAFSQALLESSFSQKQEALINLLEYIEESPDIPDVSADGEHILDTIYWLVVELLERDLTPGHERLTVTERSLSDRHEKSLRAFGFDLYQRLMMDRPIHVAA